MVEMTEDTARKIGRAAQILSGLSRAASKDCSWLRRHPGLLSEILDLQAELRDLAATVTGDQDLGAYFREAQAVGSELSELFRAEELGKLSAVPKPGTLGAQVAGRMPQDAVDLERLGISSRSTAGS